MRRRWGWPRSHQWVALLATGIAVVAVVFVLWHRGAVTRASFQRIQVGMSQAELCGLLGRPEVDTMELGMVQGPDTYSIIVGGSDDERRQEGFMNYRRQQWASPEITIIVISDPDGSAVCRYSREGQSLLGWLDLVRSWISR